MALMNQCRVMSLKHKQAVLAALFLSVLFFAATATVDASNNCTLESAQAQCTQAGITATCPTWSEHCMCSEETQDFEVTTEFLSINDDGILGASIDATINPENNSIEVPVNTALRVTTSNFILACSNGATAEIIHPAQVFVNGSLAGDNKYSCRGSSCYGPSAISPTGERCSGQAAFEAYRFYAPGKFHVEIRVAGLNNGTLWRTEKDLNVFVSSAEIAISGPKKTDFVFEKADETKTFYVPWTFSNMSKNPVIIDSCDPVGGNYCEFEGMPLPFTLETGQRAMALQKIELGRPNAFPQEINPKFRLSVTGPAGGDLSRHWVESPNLDARLDYLAKQKFHVELLAGGRNAQCVSPDGKPGFTGESALPKILLTWNWNDIAIDACDKKDSGGFVYCDPTQFSIELLQKLSRIDGLMASGNTAQAAAESEFDAYLIEDFYSDDFRQDFDYLYTHGSASFFGTPAFYTDSQKPWTKYFGDTGSGKLAIERTDVSNSAEKKNIQAGLYHVKIAYPVSQQFFKDGQPSSTIGIQLAKISDAPDNAFYRLPFNGIVGTDRTDADGKIERKNYGIGFTNDTQIPIVLAGNIPVAAARIGARKMISGSVGDDFFTTNVSKAGMLFEMNPSGMYFAPSRATPAIMQVIGTANAGTGITNEAIAYYTVQNDSNILGAGKDYSSAWTGIGSTNSCRDFYNANLFRERRDSKAENRACLQSQNAFGFAWKNVLAHRLFLQSVFFSPLSGNYFVQNACNGSGMAFFGIGQENVQKLPLSGLESGATLREIFERVREGRACVSYETGSVGIWWNPEPFKEDLTAIKEAKIGSGLLCEN